MPGILPDSTSGGLIIRDAAGVCLAPVNVVNAYCPPAAFASTCQLTALPSDCTARISAAQINALVSELLCLAVALNPTGSWNCASVCNLSAAFTAWQASRMLADQVTVLGTGTTADRYRTSPTGVATQIAASAAAVATLCTALTPCMQAIAFGPAGGALTGTYPNPGLSPPAVLAALGFVDQCGTPLALGAALVRPGIEVPLVINITIGPTGVFPVPATPGTAAPTPAPVRVLQELGFLTVTNNFCRPAVLHLTAGHRIQLQSPAAARTQVWTNTAQLASLVQEAGGGAVAGFAQVQLNDSVLSTTIDTSSNFVGYNRILAPGASVTFDRYVQFFNNNDPGENIESIVANLPSARATLIPF